MERAGISLPILEMRKQRQLHRSSWEAGSADCYAGSVHCVPCHNLRTTLSVLLFFQGGAHHLHFPIKKLRCRELISKGHPAGILTQVCRLLKVVVLTDTIPRKGFGLPAGDLQGVGGWSFPWSAGHTDCTQQARGGRVWESQAEDNWQLTSCRSYVFP